MKKEKVTEKMENIGGRIPEKTAHDMRVFCAIHKIKQVVLIDTAIREYLERQGK
jgi:hypothetical protein